MATAEQMAAYATALRQFLPAQNKPVTEIAIFKLLEPQSDSTLAYFEKEIIANTRPGTGIKRQAWGFSSTDPRTLVWMLDWEKIQDHWDFWQTPAFPPVIACIDKLFEAGRPLVRHYEFKPAEMLPHVLQRVFVWNDDGAEDSARVDYGQGRAGAKKDAFAVDMEETTWRCVVMGYDSAADADADSAGSVERESVESHLLQLKFAEREN